jgi:hypothetical protein
METANATKSSNGGPQMTLSERADALEEKMIEELDYRIQKSVLFTLGEQDPTRPERGTIPAPQTNSPRALQGDDPRLQKMPARPTLLDFFKYRFGSANHLLQSANLARKAGCEEKIVLACLLHDIAVTGFIRSDHGYWGAQLVGPYVDEEVSWAIRAHQALRFYPDESFGYSYPDMYVRMFGEDFKPEPYIEEAYQKARNHKWYGTARLITVNDIYAFDPNVHPVMDDFVDVIGRHFKQPEEGLGFDGSPVAHMWRTIIWPTRAL